MKLRDRIFAFARYIPAGVLAFLLISWLVGIFQHHAFALHWQRSDGQYFGIAIGSMAGSVGINCQPISAPESGLILRKRTWKIGLATVFGGRFSYRRGVLRGVAFHRVAVPMPWIVIALLPIAVGAIIRWKFPLWMYFAWVSLFAVALTAQVIILRSGSSPHLSPEANPVIGLASVFPEHPAPDCV